MPEGEQRDRMRLMRELIRDRNVYRWAAQMLMDASRLRKRERIHARDRGLRSTKLSCLSGDQEAADMTRTGRYVGYDPKGTSQPPGAVRAADAFRTRASGP